MNLMQINNSNQLKQLNLKIINKMNFLVKIIITAIYIIWFQKNKIIL